MSAYKESLRILQQAMARVADLMKPQRADDMTDEDLATVAVMLHLIDRLGSALRISAALGLQQRRSDRRTSHHGADESDIDMSRPGMKEVRDTILQTAGFVCGLDLIEGMTPDDLTRNCMAAISPSKAAARRHIEQIDALRLFGGEPKGSVLTDTQFTGAVMAVRRIAPGVFMPVGRGVGAHVFDTDGARDLVLRNIHDAQRRHVATMSYAEWLDADRAALQKIVDEGE